MGLENAPHIPKLHVIPDTTVQSTWTLGQLANWAWASGDVAVQYRKKDFDPLHDAKTLQALSQASHKQGKCLIINDSTRLALQYQASGVHLGKEDGPVTEAIQLLGPNKIVGATVHDFEELEALEGLAISYIGVGPVFGTTSKNTGLPDLGLKKLARICHASPFPVIAIGGIGLDQVKPCLDAGAYGVAILGAYSKSKNPQAFATQVLAILEGR